MNKKKIAVLGAGTMGPGIVTTYIMHGYEVSLYSRSQATLEQAKGVIASNLELLAAEDTEALAARVSYTTQVAEAVRDAWYIVETIVEKAEAKIALYTQLDEILPPEVIIASNTSALNIFELMPQRRQPYTVISHWFAPAHILPLVEVVRGPETLDSVMDQTEQLHKNCGKTTVRMERFIPGFIINRLQGALSREFYHLVENGYCTAEDMDLAVKTSLMPRGMLLGVMQRMDFAGLDMCVNALNNNRKKVPPEFPERPSVLYDPVDRGDLSVKTGKGIYDYSHKPYEQVLRERDEQLLRSVKLAQEFMENPLHKQN